MPNQVRPIDPVTRRHSTDIIVSHCLRMASLPTCIYSLTFLIPSLQFFAFRLTSRLRTFRSDNAASRGFLRISRIEPATMQVDLYTHFFVFI